MATTARECVKCGAPLQGEGAELRCVFCGTVQREDEPRAVETGRRPALDTPTKESHGRTIAIVAIAAIGLGAGLVAALVTRAPAPTSAPHEEAALRIAELARWSETRPRLLEAPGMPTSFAAFDPIAAAPWALQIAQQWSPDAQLDSLDVHEVSSAGTIDARIRGAGAVYTFVSPARRAAFAQMMEVADRPALIVFLRVRVEEGRVRVAQTSAGSVAGALPSPVLLGCPLATLVANARAQGLAARPHYDVDLRAVRRDAAPTFRWFVDAPRGTRLEADVYDPRTCEPTR